MDHTIQRLKALMLEARLLLDELDDTPPPPPPDNVVALKPDEVELEGVIGRPQFREVNGKSLFTAGLGVSEGNVTQWSALVAWGSTAEQAASLRRGQLVRVVGKQKQVSYVDSNGVMQQRQELHCSLISPVSHVSEKTVGSA